MNISEINNCKPERMTIFSTLLIRKRFQEYCCESGNINGHLKLYTILNIETNLILYFQPEKCIKFNQSEIAYTKPGNLKFCTPFKINIQKRKELSNLKNPVFDFSLIYPRKSSSRRKSKVFSSVYFKPLSDQEIQTYLQERF